jgi:hypothetical protein
MKAEPEGRRGSDPNTFNIWAVTDVISEWLQRSIERKTTSDLAGE